MKKILIILLIIFITILITFIPTAKTISVYSEIENDFNYIDLDISNCNINTNNFNEYIDDLKIIKIKPDINKIYENKINIKEYEFNVVYNNLTNIKKFKDYFVKQLKGYNTDNMIIDGIKINNIVAYMSKEELNNLNKKCQNKINYKIL